MQSHLCRSFTLSLSLRSLAFIPFLLDSVHKHTHTHNLCAISQFSREFPNKSCACDDSVAAFPLLQCSYYCPPTKKRRISVRCEREKKHTVNYFCWNILSLALSFLTLWHFVASAISLPNMHGRWHTIAWIIQILVCPKPIFTIGNKLVEVDDTFKRIISCNLIRMRSHSFFLSFHCLG